MSSFVTIVISIDRRDLGICVFFSVPDAWLIWMIAVPRPSPSLTVRREMIGRVIRDLNGA